MLEVKGNYHPLLLIRSFKACGHGVQVDYGAGQTAKVNMSLNGVEKLLGPLGFVRVHRSYIVNAASVISYTSRWIEMDNESEVPISRSYREAFDEAMRGQAAVTAGGPE